MTKLTRMDERLAAAIADVKGTNERIRMAVRIGRVCAEWNSRFNWKQWDKACKVDFNFREKGN